MFLHTKETSNNVDNLWNLSISCDVLSMVVAISPSEVLSIFVDDEVVTAFYNASCDID